MERDVFLEGMEELAGAFLDERLTDEKISTVWYKNLKDLSDEDFADGVARCIRDAAKKPSISELRGFCKEAAKMRRILATARGPEFEETDEPFNPEDMDDRARHPFEEGWRVKDGKWVKKISTSEVKQNE